MFSMSITNALTASQLKRLSERFSVKTLLKVAFLFLALALFLVPFVNNLWMLLIPALIFGIGQGMNSPCNQSILAGIAPLVY